MVKKLKRLLFSRVFIVGFFIAIQLALILSVAVEFTKYFILYYIVMSAVAISFVLRIIYTNQHMAYKLAWIIIILLFPAFGVAVYCIFSGNRLSNRSQNKMRFIGEITEKTLATNEAVMSSLKKEGGIAELQTRYILNTSKYPPLFDFGSRYYKTGEEAFPDMLAALEKAEKYIFLEYFIIDYGEMWDKILEILVKKASEGVECRIIYDDIGSIMTLRRSFCEELEKVGIKCRVFHRFVPVLSAHQNNRDHRKICVVDGKLAFTGGINIADEYINKVDRFGYWKDNALMVTDEAAWSFTVMFLSMWDYLDRTPPEKRGNYDSYSPSFGENTVIDMCGSEGEHIGYVQPYSDNPLDFEPVGENVYLGMISAARDYIWIATPYLIIDEQMEQALIRSAKSGVDVRIITPGIPDKKIINETTKSFYPNLLVNGIKIYEYTPGFLHAKTFLCDGKYATVGSVNLDYRSLYLHFECGVWMCKSRCISDIKDDFDEMFKVSKPAEITKVSLLRELFRGVLELIAPLL